MEQMLQNLWAHTTLDVVEKVASEQGKRMYRDDWNLREDLNSWLTIKACEFANKYNPDHNSKDPEAHWRARLWTMLRTQSRWHWENYQGRSKYNMEGAAKTLHLSALTMSKDGRDDLPMPATAKMTGTPDLTPEAYMDRIEHLEELLARLESGDIIPGPKQCVEWRCGNPPQHNSPRCHAHQRAYKELNNPTSCTTPGCDTQVRKAGLCSWHYRNSRPPCIEPGCEKPNDSRGLCSMHYQRIRKEEKANE